MTVTCLVDNTVHESVEAMHKHLQFKLRLKQADYYQRYHPRVDRLTGQPLPFKSVEQYLASEFLSKDTLRRWIAANPEEGKQWAIDWLRRRKIDKALRFPPTQVELRSLLCPSIHYYQHMGDYGAICRELGYETRFDGDVTKLAAALWPSGAKVLVDTREQAPLKLNVPIEAATLSYGDYALDAAHSQDIHIERKSISDFAGTLSDRQIARQREVDSNLERFTRELERAQEAGIYLIMLVEDTIDHALELGTESSHLPKRGSMTGAHLFHNLRDLLHRFDNFQALFVDGRKQAAAAVVKLLALGTLVKRIDLQWAHEAGKLRF